MNWYNNGMEVAAEFEVDPERGCWLVNPAKLTELAHEYLPAYMDTSRQYPFFPTLSD